MSRQIVLALAALAALTSPSVERYEHWVDAPLGIAVTTCDYSTRGVSVKFETDIEPPYVVGLYRTSEEGIGRRFPVAEVVTSDKFATITGDFTCVTLFVQVLAKSVVDRYDEDDIGHRTISQAEWTDYASAIRNAEPYVNTNANVTFEIDSENRMELIEDWTWTGFHKTDQTNLTFTLAGKMAVPKVGSVTTNTVQDFAYTNIETVTRADHSVVSVTTNVGLYATESLSAGPYHYITTLTNSWGGIWKLETFHHPMHNDHDSYTTNYLNNSWDLVPHDYSFRLRNGRNDVGTGYRIMMFEDTGVCQAQRAYSARTNMSDAVVLPCGFRALSSHNGYIYTTDWEGRRYFQKVTNKTDHVIRIGGAR